MGWCCNFSRCTSDASEIRLVYSNDGRALRWGRDVRGLCVRVCLCACVCVRPADIPLTSGSSGPFNSFRATCEWRVCACVCACVRACTLTSREPVVAVLQVTARRRRRAGRCARAARRRPSDPRPPCPASVSTAPQGPGSPSQVRFHRDPSKSVEFVSNQAEFVAFW